VVRARARTFAKSDAKAKTDAEGSAKIVKSVGSRRCFLSGQGLDFA